MIGVNYWLIDFDDSIKNKVRFSNNNTILAKGIGKVMIQRKNGKPAYGTDVLYVPLMKNNFLSLGQLLERGFSINMKHNYIEVFDSMQILMLKAHLLSKNKTFKVNLSTVEVLDGLPFIKPPKNTCEGCHVSKQPRNAIKSYAHSQARQSLGVVHLDMCGLIETPSL
ncbi:hypothetical protein CR513_08339, partial [Mucuna pruriens]